MTPHSGIRTLPFQFTGQGGEYFRIWIVNLALTILTLGIYSAWAKVRRQQYFYRNTHLAGSNFDYHGEPMAILKGRILGVLLLVLYQVAGNFSPTWGLFAFVLLMLVFPWLVQRSLRFKLHNSSYRGLRFGFDGLVGGAYKAFLLWPAVAYTLLGLLIWQMMPGLTDLEKNPGNPALTMQVGAYMAGLAVLGAVLFFTLGPLTHHAIKTYQHSNSRFGRVRAAFDASVGSFFGIYLKSIGLLVLIALLVAGLGAVLASFAPLFGHGDIQSKKQFFMAFGIAIVVMFYLLVFMIIGPWFSARMQNLVWNHTSLGGHAIASHVRARGLSWIYLVNFVGIILTLGLFKPFADIRLARYRLEHMALNTDTSLEEFLAGQQQSVNAMGEETADLFDFDISF